MVLGGTGTRTTSEPRHGLVRQASAAESSLARSSCAFFPASASIRDSSSRTSSLAESASPISQWSMRSFPTPLERSRSRATRAPPAAPEKSGRSAVKTSSQSSLAWKSATPLPGGQSPSGSLMAQCTGTAPPWLLEPALVAVPSWPPQPDDIRSTAPTISARRNPMACIGGRLPSHTAAASRRHCLASLGNRCLSTVVRKF
mmetsp:Transcript_106063/g.300050  ORF Transcript_106063/g.300050 Transcript_106063/m.300050 type:complete len:201 (-) Transcript_106063:348-950(-)